MKKRKREQEEEAPIQRPHFAAKEEEASIQSRT